MENGRQNNEQVPYSHLYPRRSFYHLLANGVPEDQYFETYYSLFDGDAQLSVNFYPRNPSLIKGTMNILRLPNWKSLPVVIL